MSLASTETIIQRDELPRFNGEPIASIHAVYENSRYGDGGYLADVLYYNVYIRTWGARKSLKVKDLPKEFSEILGKFVENKGRRIFITSLYFRENGSGNGSFTDESLDISGWNSNSTSGSFELYRGVEWMEKPNLTHVINIKSKLGKLITSTFNKDFEVKEVEFYECGSKMEEGSLDFASTYPYPHTPIRFIDNMVYKDEKLPSWRPYAAMPYMLPTLGGTKDREMIRVWDQGNSQHLFLEKVKDLRVEDSNLLVVTFSHNSSKLYGNIGNAYCNVRRYTDNEYLRFKVTKLKKDGSVECELTNRKTAHNKRLQILCPNDLYRIMAVFNSSYTE